MEDITLKFVIKKQCVSACAGLNWLTIWTVPSFGEHGNEVPAIRSRPVQLNTHYKKYIFCVVRCCSLRGGEFFRPAERISAFLRKTTPCAITCFILHLIQKLSTMPVSVVRYILQLRSVYPQYERIYLMRRNALISDSIAKYKGTEMTVINLLCLCLHAVLFNFILNIFPLYSTVGR